MKENLTIKALKYISERNGEYKFVELKNFLLNNFEEKPDFIDRYDIKSFLVFLSLSEFIKTDSTNGIDFIVESGRKIPREEVSAKVKITSKGFDLLREYNKNRINNVSILINIFFGFLTIIFAFWGLYLNNSQENVKSDIQYLKEEILHLKLEVFKSDYETEYTKKNIRKK